MVGKASTARLTSHVSVGSSLTCSTSDPANGLGKLQKFHKKLLATGFSLTQRWPYRK